MVLDVQQLINDALQQGQDRVVLPAGVFQLPGPVDIPPGFSVLGASRKAFGVYAATTLQVPDGQPYGVRLAGAAAYLEGIALEPIHQEQAGPVGIYVSGHDSEVYGCSVHWFAEVGIYVHATSGEGTNANNFGVYNCRVIRCGVAGIYINGAETNAGAIEDCDCSSNFGYGYFESSFLGNSFRGCHASLNALGNYAQGGEISDPDASGVSNYSVYESCYSEGSTPNYFKSAQILLLGGNLGNGLSAQGWPDAQGQPTPFPGQRAGFRSKLRFEAEGVVAQVPSTKSLAHAVLAAGEKAWYTVQKWAGSPSWLANTVALLRYDKTGWLVPFAATEASHPRGPGRRVHATPLFPTPHDFVLSKDVVLVPGVPQDVQFDSSLLLPTGGGYLGRLVFGAPSVSVADGSPEVAIGPVRRVDTNTVKVLLTPGGWAIEVVDPNQPFVATVGLFGVRVEEP